MTRDHPVGNHCARTYGYRGTCDERLVAVRHCSSTAVNAMGVGMGSFAEALRALMDQRDMSGCALARKVPCHRSLISRYINGHQQPSRKMARRLDEVLGARGKLIDAARPVAETETEPGTGAAAPSRRSVLAGGLLAGGLLGVGPETRERLAWAALHPPRIDRALVHSLADVLAGQRRAEDALGSAVMLQAAVAQLEVVEDLVRQARGPLRPALIHVAQQWAQFTAWLLRNLQDTAAARAVYAQGLEWAAEIGDRTMAATIFVERGYMAVLAGEAGTVIGLAQAAQQDKTIAAGQYRRWGALEARGHATAGDSAAAERKLSESRDFAARLAERPQDRRPWSYFHSPAFFECEAGITLGCLAADPRYRKQATTALHAGYGSLPDEAKTSEWGARYLAVLAGVHTQDGNVGEACTTAREVAGTMRLTGSVRLAEMLATVYTDLQARYPDDARVHELADALA